MLSTIYIRLAVATYRRYISFHCRPFETTDEGYEAHFGINCLGHLYLARLLLPLLHATGEADPGGAAARIINVSSAVRSPGWMVDGWWMNVPHAPHDPSVSLTGLSHYTVVPGRLFYRHAIGAWGHAGHPSVVTPFLVPVRPPPFPRPPGGQRRFAVLPLPGQ